MQSLSPRSLRRLLAALLIATAGLLGSTAYAQSPDPDEVSIEGVDFTYRLGRDADGLATLQVTEVWRINFPASGDYSNFNRDIPRHYRDADVWGEEPTAQASSTGVPIETSVTTRDDGDEVRIRLEGQGEVTGLQVWTIEYSLVGVAFDPNSSDNDTNDQLYWQVAPAEMPVPLGEVTARVEVAPDLMGALDGRTRCLIGASYDDTECELTQDGTTFSAAATFDEAREGMTFVLGFHEGTFQRPWIPHEHFWSYNAVGLGMLVGTAGVVWAWIRSARGMRKPRRGTVVAPQVRPPKKLGLRVAGTVVNAKPANITAAEVLGLAITGSLTVSEKDDTIILERSADPSGEAYALGLRHFHEGLRRTTEIPLVGRSEGLRGAVRASAHDAKRQAKPYLRWNPWPSVLLAVLAALVVLAFVLQGSDFRTDNPPAVTLLVVAPLIIFIPVAAVFWAARATRLTREGKEVLRDLAGLRWLIEMSEAERLRWLQSPDTAPRERIGGDEREVLRLYETLLPWAALFGHQHEWSDLLRNHAAAADLPDVDYGWTTTLTMPAWDTGLAAVGTGSTLDSGGSGGGSYDGGGFSGGSDVGGGGGGGGGSFD